MYLEALTNLSYVAGTCQSSYKLAQEVAGLTQTRDQIGTQLWKQFQDTTCFSKIIGDIETAFSNVSDNF